MMEEYPIKIGIGYEEKASRLEALIIRWVYGLFLSIIAGIWGLVVYIVLVVQWIVIMITGKRNMELHNFVASYFRFYTRLYGYVYLLTDKRPPISGK